jgi:hypothetical protein
MTNTLYIDPLLPEIQFLIFQEGTTITKTLPKNFDTASTFPKILVDLVDIYKVNEILCVTGPGPFTLMRVVTLAINALSYTRNIRIKSCNFFDLITSNTIGIIEANTHEYLTKDKGIITSVAKDFLQKWTYEGIISWNLSTEETKYIQYKDNKNNLFHVFLDKPYEIKIAPIYFKPPHITWPKI